MTTGADQQRFAEAYARVRGDRSIQTDLPAFVPPKPPGWIEPLIDFLRWLSPAFPYLFWIAVIVAVAAIAYVLVRNTAGFGWTRRQRAVVVEDAWTPDVHAARALLAEAEALAAQGRYAEAARLLLQRSVEDIGQRRPQFLKPSLTARDIAAAPTLPEAARPAFASIARVVEVSAFGAQSVSRDAWEACRAAYARFALPEVWRPARG